jgi:hypothetical protein
VRVALAAIAVNAAVFLGAMWGVDHSGRPDAPPAIVLGVATTGPLSVSPRPPASSSTTAVTTVPPMAATEMVVAPVEVVVPSVQSFESIDEFKQGHASVKASKRAKSKDGNDDGD